MTKDEALKLALEALEKQVQMANGWQSPAEAKAITALRQAIEQAQQEEPVALRVYRGELCYKSQEDDQSFGMWCPVTQDCLPFAEGTKFYASPPPRQPLTDEQIEPMFKARQKLEVTGEKDAWYFYAWGVNDGEAAHGIKGEA